MQSEEEKQMLNLPAPQVKIVGVVRGPDGKIKTDAKPTEKKD